MSTACRFFSNTLRVPPLSNKHLQRFSLSLRSIRITCFPSNSVFFFSPFNHAFAPDRSNAGQVISASFSWQTAQRLSRSGRLSTLSAENSNPSSGVLASVHRRNCSVPRHFVSLFRLCHVGGRNPANRSASSCSPVGHSKLDWVYHTMEYLSPSKGATPWAR